MHVTKSADAAYTILTGVCNGETTLPVFLCVNLYFSAAASAF